MASKICRVCAKSLNEGKMQCPHCRSWNMASMVTYGDSTVLLSEVKADEFRRIITGPWDTCLGGIQEGVTGIVTTAAILLGGEPGAGKSTIAAQIADSIAGLYQKEVFYISAEETPGQVNNRFVRLGLKNLHLIRVLPVMGMGSDDFAFQEVLRKHKPKALFLDSVSAIMKEDLNVGIGICESMKLASIELDAPSFITCHVNKDGDLAGLKKMEHTVDSCHVMMGINRAPRTMRSTKNRFGMSYDLVFEMTEKEGLVHVTTITGDEDE